MYVIFSINLNYYVLLQILCLQGMQLMINSSKPQYVDWHNDGIVEFVSSRAFVWYAEPHITLSDRVFITYMGKDPASFRLFWLWSGPLCWWGSGFGVYLSPLFSLGAPDIRLTIPKSPKQSDPRHSAIRHHSTVGLPLCLSHVLFWSIFWISVCLSIYLSLKPSVYLIIYRKKSNY